MPRLVRHDLSGPIKIEPQDKPVWVCGCGLSAKFPFCDGAHKAACKAEPPGVLCVYGPDKKTIVETRPDDAPAPPPAPSPQS